MKSEDDPIADDEFLLRRVRRERFPSQTKRCVSPNAFEPRLNGRDVDTDGISLYRAACVADPVEILTTIVEDKRSDYGIVRLSVAYVKSLGLSVLSASLPPIKGHVVIPELNATDYKAQMAVLTPIKKSLASEASKDENIVRHPEPLPGD